MQAKFCIFGCHHFHQEIVAAIAAEGWDDVLSIDFPARCGRPPLSWEEIQTLLPEDCSQILLLGRACLAGLGDPPPGIPPVRWLVESQCFNLIAPSHLVNQALENGGYLISPGWLQDWPDQLAKLGFDRTSSAEFFKDFARQLVLLDTGVSANAAAQLAEMAECVGLPSFRYAVGLDTIRLSLARFVLEWRLDNANRQARQQRERANRELADHVTAMDMLARLTKTQKEAEAIVIIEELFLMLFAPKLWCYLPVQRGKPWIKPELPETIKIALQSMSTAYAWTPSGCGFMLRISRNHQVLGLIVADHFAFPAYREHYLNLALAMTDVFGLAIENARNRDRLLEAEKLASLGMMVAGVAHEINTPLGISLTATTSQLEQSQTLAQHFSERRMTQSELQNYLINTQDELELLYRNLNGIGRLIDSFRQVALENKPQHKSRFGFKHCMSQVIDSLAPHLAGKLVQISIDCDDKLEIESYAEDWASLLSNLLSNSLRHGFKDRENGCIEIVVRLQDELFLMDYSDDGIGLEKSALARIFNPFFTTDLQNGTGLGMYLVHNLITHRLGGSIECESQPGLGIHFHIETPL